MFDVKLETEGSLLLIFVFILIDLFNLNDLWNENFLRRFLHHIQGGNYNRNKIPFVKFMARLKPQEINYIKSIADKFNKDEELKDQLTHKTKKYLSILGAFLYSKRKALYFNHFDKLL